MADKSQSKKDQAGEQTRESAGEEKTDGGGVAQNEEGENSELDEETRAEKESKEKEPRYIPEDFFYDVEEHWSKPLKSTDDLPDDMLTLYHSFGYPCCQRNNLHSIDDHRLMFAAGAYLQIIHTDSMTSEYLPTTGGGSIGALAVHPQGRIFAVGEKGSNPDVNIFTTSNYRLYRILRGGTTTAYNALAFNQTGELLASQGAEPDYMVTVWNWQQETILLRSKSFSQEVNYVSFNRELKGSLTTAGVGHIKFWKMARTFTGLKLQGAVGRSGKTELSNIEGYVEFPDGKVLSGSDWGNMLLWDDYLIKLQIGRKVGKLCHDGKIMHMMIVEGEIITAGLDGYVKSWNLELVDMLEATEESGLVEIDPMNEVLIGPDVLIYYLTQPPNVRSVQSEADKGEEQAQAVDSAYLWYCQDGAGGIWQCDLSFRLAAHRPKRLLSFHAGAIVACDVSPVSYLVMTLGEDGTLRLYDFLKKKLLAVKQFKAKGSSLVWIPLRIDNKCSTVMAGFSDGGIRRMAITNTPSSTFVAEGTTCSLMLMEALKPHDQSVTALAYGHHVNGNGTVTLLTCSMDKTLFLFHVVGETYEPLCFIPMLYVPRRIFWSPDLNTADYFMVTCDDGVVVEVIQPYKVDHTETLEFKHALMRVYQFPSVKSMIMHDEEMELADEKERKWQEERVEKNKLLLVRGIETPSQQELRIDQENYTMAAEKKKKEQEQGPWKPFIPPHPSPILQTIYPEGNSKFWLILGEYDAGFLYECEFSEPFSRWAEDNDENEMTIDKKPPLRSIRVKDAEDMPIPALCFNSEGNCVFYGLQNGRIRLQFLENEMDISSVRFHWSVGAHDVTHGAITGMKLSHDESFLITVGEDGNIFVFITVPAQQLTQEITISQAQIPGPVSDLDSKAAEDLEPKQYTIEQAKQKSDYDKMVMLAEMKKQDKRVEITSMRARFRRLLAQNQALPAVHRLTPTEFVLDECHAQLIHTNNKDKIRTMRKEMAWGAEKCRLGYDKLKSHYMKFVKTHRFCISAMNKNVVIYSFRLQHHKSRKITVRPPKAAMPSEVNFHDHKDKPGTDDEAPELRNLLIAPLTAESFVGMSERTAYLLRKVEEKRLKRAQRKIVWRKFLETKPGDDYEDPADQHAIQEAYNTMGFRHLKSEDNYIVPDSYKLTMNDGTKRIAACEKILFDTKNAFNTRLLSLREKKVETIKEIQVAVDRLREIQKLNILDDEEYVLIPAVPVLSRHERPSGSFAMDHQEEQMLRNEARTNLRKIPQQTQRHDNQRRESVFSKAHRKSSLAIAKENFFKLMEEKTSQNPPKEKSIPITSNIEAYLSSDKVPMLSRMTFLENKTELQIELTNIEKIRLKFEQDQLLQKIQRLKDVFDIEHHLIRHDKFILDVTIKTAQIRMNTLEEEQLVLVDCESRENSIGDQIDASLVQKVEVDKVVKRLLKQIIAQTKELEEHNKAEKRLLDNLNDIIGESNAFSEFLVKVYKKKIKRKVAEKHTDDDEEETSESESDSLDLDEESDEDDDDAVHYDLSVCPQGCSQEIYNEVIELREKRLDLDEMVSETKKVRDALTKDLEACNKKRQAADANFAKIKQELTAFQLEKQRRVNNIDIQCVIQLHQIQALRRNNEFVGITDELLIDDSEVMRLQKRINELKNEKKEEHTTTVARGKLNVHLNHEKNLFLERLAEYDEMCNREMFKKFGQMVNLEVVETVTADPQVEDVRSKLVRTQMECDKDLRAISKVLKDVVQENVDSIRIDTEYKLAQAAQKARHFRLSKNLDQWLTELKMGIDEHLAEAPKECEELMDVVAAQREAIKALTNEIQYLQGNA